MAANVEEVSMPDWHRQALAERLASYHANPSEGKTWEEFEQELLEKLKRKLNK